MSDERCDCDTLQQVSLVAIHAAGNLIDERDRLRAQLDEAVRHLDDAVLSFAFHPALEDARAFLAAHGDQQGGKS